MRFTKKEREAKIVSLYKSGWSYKQLQKRYTISPNYLSKLVKDIEVKCAACGKHKGKARFHAFHPDRINRPNYTITLCPSCHAKEELKLQRDKPNQSRTPSADTTQLINKGSHPSTALPTYQLRPLSKTEKKVIGGGLVTLVLLEALPKLLDDIRRHLQKPDNSRKKPIMGLKKFH